MTSASEIKNEKILTDLFGHFPSFHDAEIVSIHLERQGEDAPFLETKIHIRSENSKADDRSLLVTLRFTHIKKCEIKGFNHQNVLSHLEIDQVEVEEHKPRRFQVRFPSLHGCEAALSCREVIIIDAKPFAPAR
jgi:hypothetical protein